MAASGCNDANAGTSAGSPWCTVNHAVNAGDVIIAAPGTYNGDFSTWGVVSNSPSTTPGTGIDGTAGIYAAILLCGGSDLNSCIIDCATGACNIGHVGNGGSTANPAAMNINQSNWSVQGWTIKGNASARGIQIDACLTQTTNIHDISVINNVISNAYTAFTCDDCAYNQSTTGNGADYMFGIGNIAQNAAQEPICTGAFVAAGPKMSDSNAGTHILFDGNFAIHSRTPPACASDGEGLMFDSPDAHGYTAQQIARNNMIWDSERQGLQVTYHRSNPTFAPSINIYQNTLYGNCAVPHSGDSFDCGELEYGTVAPFSTTINMNTTVQNNLTLSPNATAGGGTGEPVYGLDLGGLYSSMTVGGSGHQNFFTAVATTCNNPGGCDSGSAPFSAIEHDGASLGTNTYGGLTFNNTSDLLTNWTTSVPNCTGKENTVQCMGYDAFSGTLTTNTPISDLTTTTSGTSGKGYQKPAQTCPATDADFPSHLKGLVYLHWTGTQVEQRAGLVNVPCGH